MKTIAGDDKWRRRAVITGWITAGACFGLFAVTIPFVIPAMRKHCLPYVPATPVQVTTILSQLKGRSGKVIDLGSGDGRVVGTCVHATLSLISVLVMNWITLANILIDFVKRTCTCIPVCKTGAHRMEKQHPMVCPFYGGVPSEGLL